LPVSSDHIGRIALLIAILAPIIETCKFSQDHCGKATQLTDKTYNWQHAWPMHNYWPVLFQD
jgi:hypothetical protein